MPGEEKSTENQSLTVLNPPVFDAGTDRWSTYKARLNFYFAARKLTQDQIKKDIFLSITNLSTFELINSLLIPKKIADSAVTFQVITDLLDTHFDDKKSTLPSVYSFYTCHQKQGQSITDWVAELKDRARQCNFSDEKWKEKALDRAIRDMIVVGTSNSKIRDSYEKKFT